MPGEFRLYPYAMSAEAADHPWPDFDAYLAKVHDELVAGTPVEITIRELISYVNAERRGARVIEDIQAALDRHRLVTEPPFTSGWIDSSVAIQPAVLGPGDQSPLPEVGRTDASEPPEVTLTVSSLKAATRDPVSIEQSSGLELARALMLRHDYSQLAVMAGPRRLVGAISWESMARAAIHNRDFTLRDATVPATSVAPDNDLIALIPTIIDQGFVFVVRSDHTLGGIVTTADLSSQFGTVAKPFLLIGEIERRLRLVLSAHFEPSELADVRDPGDTGRTITSVNDLTIGEIARCIESRDNWQRLGWPVDRVEFVHALGAVRDVRNEVMHFSPDPLTPAEESALQNFVGWLRVMAPTT
jgi:CBS domain-containing protein